MSKRNRANRLLTPAVRQAQHAALQQRLGHWPPEAGRRKITSYRWFRRNRLHALGLLVWRRKAGSLSF